MHSLAWQTINERNQKVQQQTFIQVCSSEIVVNQNSILTLNQPNEPKKQVLI